MERGHAILRPVRGQRTVALGREGLEPLEIEPTGPYVDEVAGAAGLHAVLANANAV